MFDCRSCCSAWPLTKVPSETTKIERLFTWSTFDVTGALGFGENVGGLNTDKDHIHLHTQQEITAANVEKIPCAGAAMKE